MTNEDLSGDDSKLLLLTQAKISFVKTNSAKTAEKKTASNAQATTWCGKLRPRYTVSGSIKYI